VSDRELLEGVLDLAARMKAGLPLDVGAEVRKLAQVAAGQRRDTPPDGWVDTLHRSINEEVQP
jgi:hypothetical protein